MVFTLDIEPKTPVWKSSPTTSTYNHRVLRLGTGASYAVQYADGMLEATGQGEGPSFISIQSECEA